MTRSLLVHAASNAVIVALAYYWLGLPESRALTLVWSAVVALVTVALLCWTYGAALACLEANPWRVALRNLLPFAVAVLVVMALYVFLNHLVFKQRMLRVLFWVVWWVVVPVAVLPVLSGIARGGWKGFRNIAARRGLYWIQAPVLLLLGLWVPSKLIGWTPRVGSFGMQMFSLVARFGVAYFLFVASLLLLAFVTSGGKPLLTQSKTAVSP